MKEPNWENIAEYCNQRADTLFGDADTVSSGDLHDDILNLAYEYRHMARHINRVLTLTGLIENPAMTAK